MKAKISKIYICKEKGTKREEVDLASLKKDIGLVGDCYSCGGNSKRQLTILLSEDKKNIEENFKDKGICLKRFHENLLIEGVSINELNIGHNIQLGNAIIEITSIGKRCFLECDLVKNENICPLKKGAIFAKVIQSGYIKV